MVIGESQCGFVKTKWYLANLTALHDERTGSMDEERTVNVFYFVFTEVFCKIFHLSLEKMERYELVKQIPRWIENWLDCKAQSFVISDTKSMWHAIATKGITPGNETGFGKRKQFCRKDLVVEKASTQFGQWVGGNYYFPPDFWGCIWFQASW